jgi:hypothetical protein
MHSSVSFPRAVSIWAASPEACAAANAWYAATSSPSCARTLNGNMAIKPMLVPVRSQFLRRIEFSFVSNGTLAKHR